MNDKSVHC